MLEMHDSTLFEAEYPSHEYMVETMGRIKELWEDTALNLIYRDGKKLGWKIPVTVQAGPAFGDPKWKLSAGGVLLGVD